MVDTPNLHPFEYLDGVEAALIDIVEASKIIIAASDAPLKILQPSMITYLARQMILHCETAQASASSISDYIAHTLQKLPGFPPMSYQAVAELFDAIDEMFRQLLIATELLPIVEAAQNEKADPEHPKPLAPHNVYLRERLLAHIGEGQTSAKLIRAVTCPSDASSASA